MTAGPFRRVLVGWDASAGAAEALGAAVVIAAGAGYGGPGTRAGSAADVLLLIGSAFARRRILVPAATLVVRSDRGSQFRSHAFVTTLKTHGLTGSMGRVGACGDNAAMESFFALLQKNVLDRQRWTTRDQLRLAIITWIERTYHRRRRQRRLGRLTPIEYETINQAAQAA